MESKKLQEKLNRMHQHLYNADLDLVDALVSLDGLECWDAHGHIDLARRELDIIYRFLYALQEESRQRKSFTNLYKKVLDFFRRKP